MINRKEVSAVSNLNQSSEKSRPGGSYRARHYNPQHNRFPTVMRLVWRSEHPCGRRHSRAAPLDISFLESHHRAHLRLDGSLQIVCRWIRNTQIGRFTLVSRAGRENSNSNRPKIEEVRAIKAGRWRNGVVSKPVQTGSITRVSPFKVGREVGGRQITAEISLKATNAGSTNHFDSQG